MYTLVSLYIVLCINTMQTDRYFFHLAKGLSTLPDLRGHVQVSWLHVVSLATAGSLQLQVLVSLSTTK